MYKIVCRKSALKAFAKMPLKIALQFQQAFETIAINSTIDFDIKKLEGLDGYRLRIRGYRVIFRWLDDVLIIEVVDIGSRGGIYKLSVQFIEQNGVRQYAVIPAEIYADLLEKAEMLDDIKAFDGTLVQNDELVSAELGSKILAGDNKIKVWREYRHLSQAELAAKSAVSQPTIAQLEGGKRVGSLAVLKKVAVALGLDLDELV